MNATPAGMNARRSHRVPARLPAADVERRSLRARLFSGWGAGWGGQGKALTRAGPSAAIRAAESVNRRRLAYSGVRRRRGCVGLREQMAEYRRPFDAILSVATCRESGLFADLCWPPFDPELELPRLIAGRDPGVIFESATRVVVVEEHIGELRYYAGGWRSHESRIHLEQDRIEAEGYEMGLFRSPRDAVLFAESFLARELSLQDIETPRLTHRRRDTDKSGRTMG